MRWSVRPWSWSVDARLVSLARKATSLAPSVAELSSETMSNSALRAIERAPGAASSTQHRPLDDNGPSDARWLWGLVLVLLFLEWWLRRFAPAAQVQAEERARAA